jgi:HlyD family secretion protein
VDNAINAALVARANLQVAERQYALTRAGAWSYDIKNQERQFHSLSKAHESALALLDKYTVRAEHDGVVLSILASVGSYASPQGTYDTYTQGLGPVLVMGNVEARLHVRCYVDEILVPRLPAGERMRATMFVRGSTVSTPLEFVRVQPYVSPKIQLSNARTEKVDVRVLPVIFRFSPPKTISLYPGQLVDVYLGERDVQRPPVAVTSSVAREGR